MPRIVRCTEFYRRFSLHLVLFGIFALLSQSSAIAHELRPAIISVTIDKSGSIEMRASLNLEAWIVGIGGEHSDTAESDKAPAYDLLRASQPAALRAELGKLRTPLASGLKLMAGRKPVNLSLRHADIPAAGDVSLARTSMLTLDGKMPFGSTSLTWQAGKRFGDSVIRISRSGEAKPFYSSLVSAGKASPEIPLKGVVEQSIVASLLQYTVVGFEHIIPRGLDHILFVAGLFLLSPYARPLMWQVTGFTLAHSATLALGIYGVITIPASIVEPLIAASIAFIAVENLFTDKLQRWRPAVVFGFGLLHGLGFAGVLAEIGLPQDQFLTALIGFNVGVEIGQLAVLAACFLCIGLWFRHCSWYRLAVSMPASAAVALVAMVWFVERIA